MDPKNALENTVLTLCRNVARGQVDDKAGLKKLLQASIDYLDAGGRAPTLIDTLLGNAEVNDPGIFSDYLAALDAFDRFYAEE